MEDAKGNNDRFRAQFFGASPDEPSEPDPAPEPAAADSEPVVSTPALDPPAPEPAASTSDTSPKPVKSPPSAQAQVFGNPVAIDNTQHKSNIMDSKVLRVLIPLYTPLLPFLICLFGDNLGNYFPELSLSVQFSAIPVVAALYILYTLHALRQKEDEEIGQLLSTKNKDNSDKFVGIKLCFAVIMMNLPSAILLLASDKFEYTSSVPPFAALPFSILSIPLTIMLTIPLIKLLVKKLTEE